MNIFKKVVDVLIKLMIPFVYFEIHRIKITFIIDGALVFILREIMIGLYQSKMAIGEVLSLSGLLLVVGIIRTLAIAFSPNNSKEL